MHIIAGPRAPTADLGSADSNDRPRFGKVARPGLLGFKDCARTPAASAREGPGVGSSMTGHREEIP